MAQPLAGVRVLDASSFISGPLAATMLADLGADVIKVKPATGDGLARWGRRSWGESLEAQLEHEAESIIALASTDDAWERLTASAGRRSPVFRGR